MRLTRGMKELEKRSGKPIRDVLKDLYKKYGRQNVVAKELGIHQGTLSGWIALLGLEQWTVLIEEAEKEQA